MKQSELQKAKQHLHTTLGLLPELRDILASSGTIEEKRQAARSLLSERILASFDGAREIPPLEWVLARNAIRVFANLLSPRNEELTGFSLLRYLNSMQNAATSEDAEELDAPVPGFFAELGHLLRAITNKTGIYTGRVPAFAKSSGREAARKRSAYLSRLSHGATEQISRHVWGLEREAVRRRSRNRQRILAHYDATDAEWEDWQWQVRHVIRDAETLEALVELSDEEREAVRIARERGVPFGVTPYYASLMESEPGLELDHAIRAQVIPSKHYVESLDEQRQHQCSMDFMLESDTSPIDGVTRRYPMICILKPVLTCPQICVYCQRNWQITDVFDPKALMPADKLSAAIKWIAQTPELREVLITGGDPLLLSNQKLGGILAKLAAIKHIERIRIGTRTPVTLPQRITEALVRQINQYHVPGRREVVIVTHFEHPYEITPEAMQAVQRFRRYGIDVYNQLVYTYYNSRRFEACALREKLRLIGVTPYYTFNTKGKEETRDFRVPIARLLQEQKEEARLLPGTARTDEIVFNVPGLGKNYLRAGQHHDIVAILPNGRRVYEFHPWEKNLSLVNTYLYTDVSIHDYLQRLQKDGERSTDYGTIWYYY